MVVTVQSRSGNSRTIKSGRTYILGSCNFESLRVLLFSFENRKTSHPRVVVHASGSLTDATSLETDQHKTTEESNKAQLRGRIKTQQITTHSRSGSQTTQQRPRHARPAVPASTFMHGNALIPNGNTINNANVSQYKRRDGRFNAATTAAVEV